MKRSNVNPCPHRRRHAYAIRTSDGRTAILCDVCLAELEARLSDPMLIKGMLKSTMTTAEIEKMRHERENIALQQDLANTVAAAHAVAGFPQWLALPAPGVRA